MTTSNSRPLTSESFDAFNASAQAAALSTIKSGMVALPQDVLYHRSVDAQYAAALDQCSGRVLGLVNRLVGLADGKGKTRARLEGRDDVVDRFQSAVVDAMDGLLERADMSLDAYLGRNKAPAIRVNPQAIKPSRPLPAGRLDPNLLHAAHLPKPQLVFKRPVDNTRNNAPWRPTIKHKYNAQVPLGYNLRDDAMDDAERSTILSMHPYRYEITHISYPTHLFSPPSSPIPPRSYADTPFTWVSTPASLASMLAKLKRAQEIAVDLEYHSYRTFAGFVCLMQISTREEDWIVDTLELREELEELNEVFTDPKIVKVFHGAESDIQWLQQDFNIFVVNLFDTYHASNVLHFPKHSLASLLEMYCDFTADKRYQLADWRIRPLPEAMLHYARSDTHYLLYVYDCMRNALLSQTPRASPSASPREHPDRTASLRDVLARSGETALQVYVPPVYEAAEADVLARKWNKALDPVQRAVYRAVHDWRDRVAREEDESIRYVLGNQYLFTIGERAPREVGELLRVFHPVPPVIRRRAGELVERIKEVVRAQLQGGEKKVESEAMEVEVDAEVQASGSADACAMVELPEPTQVVPVELWSYEARSSVQIAVSSALLEHAKPEAPAFYSTPRSALFGESKENEEGPTIADHHHRIRDVLARIRASLTVGSTVPRPMVTEDGADPAPEPETPMQVEVPFVPLAQRQAVAPPVVDDTIVVVGQRQPKKRKRAKEEANEGKKAKAEEEVVLEPFDYAAAPNILDDQPAGREEREKKAKKKRVAKGPYEYGDFPAPPRAQREVKGGNQSHTYR